MADEVVSRWYILNEQNVPTLVQKPTVTEIFDVLEEWREQNQHRRCVGDDVINKNLRLATHFMAIDFSDKPGEGPPLVFESLWIETASEDTELMIPEEKKSRKYATWEQAEAGHREMLLEVLSNFKAEEVKA